MKGGGGGRGTVQLLSHFPFLHRFGRYAAIKRVFKSGARAERGKEKKEGKRGGKKPARSLIGLRPMSSTPGIPPPTVVSQRGPLRGGRRNWRKRRGKRKRKKPLVQTHRSVHLFIIAETSS